MILSKREARIKYRTARKTHKNFEKQIQSNVLTFINQGFAQNTILGFYWPLADEVDLRPLRSKISNNIALPVADGHGRLIYRLWSNKTLSADGCNIPAPTTGPALQPNQLSLLLVPALAIDHSGIRLGYGGGYYDQLRSDPDWRSVPAWVVLPSACISSAPLPRDSWDVPFQGWICENGAGTATPATAS